MKPRRAPVSGTMILALLLCAALLAGCTLPGNNPPPATEPPVTTPEPVAPTVTVEAPTQSPEPTLTGTPSAQAIVFSPGATAGVVTGSLKAGASQSYTLVASASQAMILILDSTYTDYYLGVTGPDGSVVLDPANRWNRVQKILPATGTYTIQVFASERDEPFTLTAKVAQMVSFGSGSNSIILSGSTVNGYVMSYSFFCNSGQTMDASLNLPATSAYLDVFGIATGVLLSPTSKATSWSGVLPSTQAYVVEVIPAAGQVVSYNLTVSCH